MEVKNKKLLFIIDNLSTGGAQRQMVNLAVGLAQRGYLIEIFCYSKGDLLAQPLIDANIPIHWYYKKSRFSFDVIFNLVKFIKRRKFDLLLSFLTTPNLYAIISGRLLSGTLLPVIVSERSCDLAGISKWESIARQFYRFSSHVLTNSHHQRENLIKNYPWLRERISTIYNGYNLDYFSPALSEPNNIPIKILCIASVSPFKNGLCLIEALRILKDNQEPIPHVNWAGQLVMMGFRLKALLQMEEALKKYGLENYWTWLKQRTDIVELLHNNDVLIHCSYIEGLPNVVCEALVCARPVIVSNTLDHPILVQQNESGYLFDFQNPNDLAEKIKMFVDLSIDERHKMGQFGRKFAEEHLSQKRLVDEYEKLFISILEKNEN